MRNTLSNISQKNIRKKEYIIIVPNWFGKSVLSGCYNIYRNIEKGIKSKKHTTDHFGTVNRTSKVL